MKGQSLTWRHTMLAFLFMQCFFPAWALLARKTRHNSALAGSSPLPQIPSNLFSHPALKNPLNLDRAAAMLSEAFSSASRKWTVEATAQWAEAQGRWNRVLEQQLQQINPMSVWMISEVSSRLSELDGFREGWLASACACSHFILLVDASPLSRPCSCTR
eukprot:755268-Pleurochrysis_carterae.AAC.1